MELSFPGITPAFTPGPNNTLCVNPEIFHNVVFLKDAVNVAGACFVAGIICCFVLMHWILPKALEVYNATKKGT